MTSNHHVPVIRFKGFTDAWEQRKLEEVCDVRDGTHDSPTYIESGYPLVTSKNLKNDGLDLSEVSFISIDDYQAINKRSKVDVGDILFGMIGTIGNPVLVKRDDFAIKNVALIKEQHELLNTFLIQLLKSPIFDRYITMENAGGTQKFLSLSKIREFVFLSPNIEEQTKIGNFFKQLDDTIALHQRELDLLKEQKKGFLQKMFPKKDEVVPEIRFAGYTDAWEQRKLGDIAKNTYGGGTPKTSIEKYWCGEFPWIQSSDLILDNFEAITPSKFITSEAINNSATKIVPKNSIAIVTRVGVGKLALVPFDYSTSQDFLSLSNLKTDGYFSLYSIYKILKKEINNLQGTSIKGITKADLLDKVISIPKSLEEQKRIGNFFKQLDDTIALHQCELEKLQEMKKAFLQKMFV